MIFFSLSVLISKMDLEYIFKKYCYSAYLSSWFDFQLDLITDLLGTPSLEAMRTACEGAKAHILRGPHKQVMQPSG